RCWRVAPRCRAEVSMDNKPLRPPTATEGTSVAASQPEGGVDGGELRSTHVIAGSSSAATENSGAPSSPALDPPTPTPGQRTLSQLGDYLLLKNLGSGAMGAVYKARQVSTKRSVALKVLFKHVADNPRLVERFNREARVTGVLDHPNIVRGYEVGE